MIRTIIDLYGEGHPHRDVVGLAIFLREQDRQCFPRRVNQPKARLLQVTLRQFIVHALPSKPTLSGVGTQKQSSCHLDDLTEGSARLMQMQMELPRPVNLNQPRRVHHDRPCRNGEGIDLIALGNGVYGVTHRRLQADQPDIRLKPEAILIRS